MKEHDIPSIKMLHEFMEDSGRQPSYSKLTSSFNANRWNLDTLHHIQKIFKCSYDEIIGEDI